MAAASGAVGHELINGIHKTAGMSACGAIAPMNSGAEEENSETGRHITGELDR